MMVAAVVSSPPGSYPSFSHKSGVRYAPETGKVSYSMDEETDDDSPLPVPHTDTEDTPLLPPHTAPSPRPFGLRAGSVQVSVGPWGQGPVCHLVRLGRCGARGQGLGQCGATGPGARV